MCGVNGGGRRASISFSAVEEFEKGWFLHMTNKLEFGGTTDYRNVPLY